MELCVAIIYKFETHNVDNVNEIEVTTDQNLSKIVATRRTKQKQLHLPENEK